MNRKQKKFWKQFCQIKNTDEETLKKNLFNGDLNKTEFNYLISCISLPYLWYSKLFKLCPQLIEKCNWSFLELGDWMGLLSEQPQFADKCDKWRYFMGYDWRNLLQTQPQLAVKCDWNKLNNCHFRSSWERGEFWGRLLKEQPQFIDKCDWSNFDSTTWVKVLESLPQLAKKCDKWDEFRTWDWSSLLCHQPQFAERFDLSRFGGWEWSEVLAKQPQLANKCYKWDNITGQGWQKLFKNGNGSFIDYCDLTTLSPYAWSWILRYLPQLADKCDRWNEFSAEDWGRLLFMQPKFADKCAWQKMNVSSILVYLLLKQPLLIQHCNITVITPKGKARLLAKHHDLAKYFQEAEKQAGNDQPELF